MERITKNEIKSKNFKTLKTVEKKIEDAKADSTLSCRYIVTDESVQAEQRLWASVDISIIADRIKYPKDLSGNAGDLWGAMHKLSTQITDTANITAHIELSEANKINEKTKSGPKRRAEAKEAFEIMAGNLFLGAYAQAKKQIKARTKEIARIQAEQKELLNSLRKSNSEYLQAQKAENAEIAKANTAAFESGEFWNATHAAIKDYFKPPFSKNYLADVSEKHRAALFLECKSESYKTAYGNWGHKLVGTGSGYLCGIDDNGDEWGHEVENLYGNIDDYGSLSLDGNSVEDAMAELFDVRRSVVETSTRQGDLLFSPRKIANDIELIEQDGPWEVRESHTIESDGMLRNGRHFKSENQITVTHTSHAPVILEPGEYRLYTLDIIDAD